MRFLFVPLVTCMLLYGPAQADGPLSFEEARAMALEKVPGTIVDTERSIHNGAVVYEFDIRQENGTVMDIEIDSVTKQVLQLRVDEVGTGGVLPEPGVTEEQALKSAIDYVNDNTSGLRRVDVNNSEYTIKNGQIVFIFKLQRGISKYEVTVNARTGEVIKLADDK